MSIRLNIDLTTKNIEKHIRGMVKAYLFTMRASVIGNVCVSPDIDYAYDFDYDYDDEDEGFHHPFHSQLNNPKKKMMIEIIERVLKDTLNNPEKYFEINTTEYIDNYECVLDENNFKHRLDIINYRAYFNCIDYTNLIRTYMECGYEDVLEDWSENKIKDIYCEFMMENKLSYSPFEGNGFSGLGEMCNAWDRLEDDLPFHTIYNIYELDDLERDNSGCGEVLNLQPFCDYNQILFKVWSLNNCFNKDKDSLEDFRAGTTLQHECNDEIVNVVHRRIENAVAVIQRSWKLCRWTAEYKICRDICNRKIDDEGWEMDSEEKQRLDDEFVENHGDPEWLENHNRECDYWNGKN